jgi:hypothetical protein
MLRSPSKAKLPQLDRLSVMASGRSQPERENGIDWPASASAEMHVYFHAIRVLALRYSSVSFLWPVSTNLLCGRARFGRTVNPE